MWRKGYREGRWLHRQGFRHVSWEYFCDCVRCYGLAYVVGFLAALKGW